MSTNDRGATLISDLRTRAVHMDVHGDNLDEALRRARWVVALYLIELLFGNATLSEGQKERYASISFISAVLHLI